MVKDGDLNDIANDCVGDLGVLGEKMGFTAPRINGIIKSFPGEANIQNRQVLQLWKRENGKNATYKALKEIAEKAKEGDIITRVETLCA